MLYAKISPALSIVSQKGPFETETKEVEYLSIKSLDYVLGHTSFPFATIYGDPIIDSRTEKFTTIKPVISEVVHLSKEEADQWGEDDTYIFNLIASKKGFNIVEIIEVEFPTSTTTSTTIL